MNEFEKFQNDWEKMKKYVPTVVGGLVLLLVGATSFYTVQPDEEAVVLRFGRYVQTNPPGLHFKIPLGVDQVQKVKTRKVHQLEFGFRSSGVPGARAHTARRFKDESLMLTGDLNVAEVEWVVQYQISDPFKFLFHASEPETNIRDISESAMRRVVGDRLVNDVLTVGRVEIANQAKDVLQEILDLYDIGVHIVTVRLQDVNPPEIVRPSFNDVNSARQEQERIINQAEREYNQVVPKARGQAEQTISEAEGYAQAVVNRAIGDVSLFRAVYAEYVKAPEVTKRRIYLETMEEVFSRFKNITIVDSKVKGLMPVFQGGQNPIAPAGESARGGR